MRRKLSEYEGQRIKVVGTINYEVENRRNKIFLKNIINAETGEYLTDHIWIDMTDQVKKTMVLMDDKLCFTGKVVIYKKGYQGHSLEKTLVTNKPSYDYKLVELQNVVSQKAVRKQKAKLDILKPRLDYLSNLKELNEKEKEELKTIIEEIEKEKQAFKQKLQENIFVSNFDIHPIRTIEVTYANFSNRFTNLPILYTFIDAIKNKFYPTLKLKEKVKHLKYTYHQIKDYKEKRKETSNLNQRIIESYKKQRITNNKLSNISEMLEIISPEIEYLESQIFQARNIIWEQKSQEPTYHPVEEKPKKIQKTIVKVNNHKKK